MRPSASQILNLLYEIRNVSHPIKMEDQNEEEPFREYQLAKIEKYMSEGSPIHMVLPAFPAKSPNPKKTLGTEPDLGEVLGLQKLNTLCDRIAEIYSPGAEITICSDGRVFSDVVLVKDNDVDTYGRVIRQIIDECGLKNLSTYSLEDVFAGTSYDEMRRLLTEEFAEDLEILRERTKSESDALALFNGIHRFMFEDQLVLFPERSKNQAREKAKGLAYEVIRRNNAWSRVVEKQFPQSLRLSIHPQSLRSTKIGVRLVDSNDLWRTPWHSVTVFDGRKYFLTPRSEAEALGAVLKYAEDKYPFYALPEACMRIEKLSPFGLCLHFNSASTLDEVEKAEIEALLQEHKLVLIRGLEKPTREELLSFCESFPQTKTLNWSFGPVMEMKESEDPQNYLFSREAVPFHWDGAFHSVPDYLVFSCVQAPVAGAGGETLFYKYRDDFWCGQ